jgi:hypothetical protein
MLRVGSDSAGNKDPMTVNLRPIQKALSNLRYTVPLDEGDQQYVDRPDHLGQQILNRIMEPGTKRLVLAGPAGCGKSTELRQIHSLAYPNYVVVECSCDRDLDLYKLDEVVLFRYIMWRILQEVETDLSQQVNLTKGIIKDVQAQIGSALPKPDNARIFFADPETRPLIALSRQHDTFSNLVSEIERSFLPVLLLADGLEKVPAHLTSTLRDFVRQPRLEHCQTVIVVPEWTLYGKDSMEFYPGVESYSVVVPVDAAFARSIVETRAGSVFTSRALDLIAEYGGGLPRDALQLAWRACRVAMDARSGKVDHIHVTRAVELMRQSYLTMLSDDSRRAQKFLGEVLTTKRLPSDPEMRDLLLGHGLVLRDDRGHHVHPLLVEFAMSGAAGA